MAVRAEIALAAAGAAPLGEQRVELLEAIGREGSISGAARAVGLSYRGAWDAICAMNNLVGRPLVAGQTGGRRGGGASLTPEGLRVVESFRRLQAELARAFRSVAPDLAGEDETAARLMFGGFIRTSARNALRGRVVAMTEGPVSAEVGLEVAAGRILVATLTSRSLRELALFPGRAAIALVKAPLIALVPAGAEPAGARNRVAGTIAAIERDAVSAEVILDIGGGKTLCATLAAEAEGASSFAAGDRATALIDPAHVILAVE